MCNIFSGRLFHVNNPCCCCNLKCGVMWLAVFDFIIGVKSQFIHTGFDKSLWECLQRSYGGKNADDATTTVIPQQLAKEPVIRDDKDRCAFLLSSFLIQMVSALMIFVAAYGNGRNLNRFFLGCAWLLLRAYPLIIIGLVFYDLNYAWISIFNGNSVQDVELKEERKPYLRYCVFLFLHAVIDLYFCFIVRLYTMECYDAYRYERIVTSTHFRRVAPKTSKAAKRFMRRVGDEDNYDPEAATRFQRTRDMTKQINADLMLLPVWDRKNEVCFYGENYRDWEPSEFFTKWQLLKDAEDEGEEDSEGPAKKQKKTATRKIRSGSKLDLNALDLELDDVWTPKKKSTQSVLSTSSQGFLLKNGKGQNVRKGKRTTGENVKSGQPATDESGESAKKPGKKKAAKKKPSGKVTKKESKTEGEGTSDEFESITDTAAEDGEDETRVEPGRLSKESRKSPVSTKKPESSQKKKQAKSKIKKSKIPDSSLEGTPPDSVASEAVQQNPSQKKSGRTAKKPTKKAQKKKKFSLAFEVDPEAAQEETDPPVESSEAEPPPPVDGQDKTEQ